MKTKFKQVTTVSNGRLKVKATARMRYPGKKTDAPEIVLVAKFAEQELKIGVVRLSETDGTLQLFYTEE